MKKRLLFFSTMFILFSLSSNAQTGITKTRYTPNVTKGYYSIGRNAEKLNNGPALQMVQTTTYNSAQKGYYTINEKRYKLPKFYRVKAPAKRVQTPVRKGYYSIDKNLEKLN